MPRSTKLDQFANAFLAPAPLFPVAHANTTPEPMIQFNGIDVFQSDAEVVHPSVNVSTDFFVPASHGDSTASACEAAQFGLETHEGFLKDGKPLADKGETEETALLGLSHTAFIPVDLRLEDLLKESADGCHHPFPGPLGLHQDDKIIAIAGDTPCFPSHSRRA